MKEQTRGLAFYRFFSGVIPHRASHFTVFSKHEYKIVFLTHSSVFGVGACLTRGANPYSHCRVAATEVESSCGCSVSVFQCNMCNICRCILQTYTRQPVAAGARLNKSLSLNSCNLSSWVSLLNTATVYAEASLIELTMSEGKVKVDQRI